MADSLLHRAGLLRDSHAGVTLALDSDKEEQKRGITISASAVHLEYPSILEVTSHQLWLKNLPWDCTSQVLLASVRKAVKASSNVIAIEKLELHAKRGYAYLSLTAGSELKSTSTLVQQLNTVGLTISGREIQVEQRTSAAFIDEDSTSDIVTPPHGDPLLQQHAQPQLSLNLIDSPGHSDFAAEVTASLRISDGCVVLVDATEGVRVQTEAVLLSALEQKVKPILVLNKVDRFFLERKMAPIDIVRKMNYVVRAVNNIITRYGVTHNSKLVKSWTVSLEDGSVVLASGYLGWATTLLQLQQLVRNVRANSGQATEENDCISLSDCVAVLSRLHRTCGKKNLNGFRSTLHAIGAPNALHQRWTGPQGADNEEPDMTQWKSMLKSVMRSLFPIATLLLSSITLHLPSPQVAQVSRTTAGALLNEQVSEFSNISQAVSKCDASQPLVVHAVKTIILPSAGSASEASLSSLTLGLLSKVMSGSISAGQLVTVLSRSTPADDDSESKNTVTMKVSKVLVLSGGGGKNKVMDKLVARAGEVCVLTGLTQDSSSFALHKDFGLVEPDWNWSEIVTKKADITDDASSDDASSDSETIYPFRIIPHINKPMVTVAVKVKPGVLKNKSKLSKRLIDAVRILCKVDGGLISRTDEETGDLLLTGIGMLHLEVILAKLIELTGIRESDGITMSTPQVAFRETATLGQPQTPQENVTRQVLGKSSNKLNRVVVTCSKLPVALVTDMQERDFSKLRSVDLGAILRTHGVDVPTKRIWSMAPSDGLAGEFPCNLLCNATDGISNIGDIQSSMVQAFQQVCSEGPFAGQKLCGVRFDILDAKIHSDPMHRKPQQIVPMGTRAMNESFANACPALMEPRCIVTAQAPKEYVKHILSTLGQVQSEIISVGPIDGDDDNPSSLVPNDDVAIAVKAWVPLRQSFSLSGDIQGRTSGRGMISFSSGDWYTHPAGELLLDN